MEDIDDTTPSYSLTGNTVGTFTTTATALSSILNSIRSISITTASITSCNMYGGGVYGNYGNNYGITNGSNARLTVKGDAEFEGDIKWHGKSLVKLLEKIEDRLAILSPDPTKLEKYESLRKAYNHYKLMEKLIGDD